MNNLPKIKNNEIKEYANEIFKGVNSNYYIHHILLYVIIILILHLFSKNIYILLIFLYNYIVYIFKL